MNQELGPVNRTVKCPEKLSAQAPLWKDILLNLIPMLILGYFVKSLFQGAGMSDAAAVVIFVLVTVGFTFYCVYITRSWKKRYEEIKLRIHKNGLSGVCPANAFHSKEFAVPFPEMNNAVGKKNRLTLNTASGRYVFILEDAEALAAELNALKV